MMFREIAEEEGGHSNPETTAITVHPAGVSSHAELVHGDDAQQELIAPPDILNYRGAFKLILQAGLPIALAKSAAAMNGFATGMVIRRLSIDSVAAAPLVFTMEYAVLGPVGGLLSPMSITTAYLNGANQKNNVGSLVLRNWTAGLVLSGVSWAIFLNADRIFFNTGIDSTICAIAQDFFNSFVYGVPALLWLTCDQQFALGIGKLNIPLITSLGCLLLNMAIGFPLALTGMGLSGLGHGVSISAWITLIGLRLYFLVRKKEFGEYYLFKINFKELFKYHKNEIKLALSMGVQVLVEWGNLFAISLMAGSIGTQVLIAIEPSFQLMNIFNLMLFAVSQVCSAKISNYLGNSEKALRAGNNALANLYRKNTQIIGNTCITIGIASAILTSIFFVSIPRELSSLFIDITNPANYEATVCAQSFLIINGLGLLVDSARLIMTGALSAYGDIIIPTLINFIATCLIGLPSGYLLTKFLDWGANWLFITRDVSILLASLALAYKWYRTVRSAENVIAENAIEDEQHLVDASPRVARLIASGSPVFSSGSSEREGAEGTSGGLLVVSQRLR